MPTPPIVYEGGEYGFANVGDSKETYFLVKHGQIVLLTWEAIVNDDMSAFDRSSRPRVEVALRGERTRFEHVAPGHELVPQPLTTLRAKHGVVVTARRRRTTSGATSGATH